MRPTVPRLALLVALKLLFYKNLDKYIYIYMIRYAIASRIASPTLGASELEIHSIMQASQTHPKEATNHATAHYEVICNNILMAPCVGKTISTYTGANGSWW